METSKLRKFASFARSTLIEQVGTRLKTVLAEKSMARRESPKVVEELEKKIKELGDKRVLEMVAYTWFNRFCALRYMDVNHYTQIGVLSPAEGQFQPEILAEAKMGHIDEELVPEATRKRVMRLLDGSDPSTDPQGEAYRFLLVAVCNYYHTLMPFMFEKIADFTELLLPDDLLSGTSIPAYTREALLPINCSPEHTHESVEVIGWLYQFYISDKKDAVMSRKSAVPTDDIPAVTQLFTPHWIVRYLVENSLGRLWMLNHPDSRLRERMPYYIEGKSETDFLTILKPEEIRLLDPACGSGHMLTYAYDLLYAIYDEQGYTPTEIPGLILKHNLFGIEICDRAAALAAFALCMKARSSDSRYFRRVVHPNVISMQDVHIAEDELDDYIQTLGLGDLVNQPMLRLLRQFEESKNFGSLIQPSLTELEIHSARIQIEDLQSKIENSPNELFLRETHIKVLRVLDQALALTKRYQIVVANPPYMGGGAMNGSLLTHVKDHFSQSKSDLGVVFIDRALSLTITGGSVAMVNQHTWLFLGSYEEFRARLLTRSHVVTALHLGPRAFPEISGEVVQSVAFVLRNIRQENYSHFVRLVDLPTSVAKEQNIRNPLRTFSVLQRSFLPLPGHIFGYWLNEQTVKVFSTEKIINDFGQARRGLQTGCSPRFIRFWHETELGKTLVDELPREECVKSRKRWFLFNNGGDFRKWHGNVDYVVNWEANGRDIKATGKAIIPSEQLYFEEGVTWSRLGGGRTAFRLLRQGIIPGDTGPTIFANGDRRVMLGYLNTAVCESFLKVLVPSMTFLTGDIENLPFKILSSDASESVRTVVNECVSLASTDWDNFETSWDFRDQPLLRPGLKGATLEASWRNWEAQSTAAIRRMQELETENNRLFIAAYGLDGDLQPEVQEEQITLARADARRDMAAFLSYSVGCMMGRYSTEVPGLILANAGDNLESFRLRITESGLQLKDLSFTPDEDGVVPILEGEWFEDDVTERFKQFLKATFGTEHFEENVRFVEESLGKSIKKYFLSDFYKDHLQTYKKRPIYWLFSSPKGTFNALIYMHRYRPDTVSTVLEYLRDFRDKLFHHSEHQQMVADSGSATKTEKTAAIKEVAVIKKQLKELEDYEKDLFDVASKKIEIDLDNGVKHNYPLFGSVLKKIAGLDAKED